MNLIKNHMQHIFKGFNYYSSKYENFISIRDFNVEMSHYHIQGFCVVFNLNILLKKTTSFKNLDRSIVIDHILARHLKYFIILALMEEDYHTLIYAVLNIFKLIMLSRNPEL